jgi:hypothetical protein
MNITVDKMKILGITIPTNGKYEDLIKLNYDEKKVEIKNIIETVLSLFLYYKTLLYLLIALCLLLEFLHVKEINKGKSDIFDEHHEKQKTKV